jgi:hypothetical protein
MYTAFSQRPHFSVEPSIIAGVLTELFRSVLYGKLALDAVEEVDDVNELLFEEIVDK